MATDSIQFLINNLQESLDVEVKNWLGGLVAREHQATLAREIIALSNNGGGHIFIGFNDEGEGHPEIDPVEGELEAFTQDNIAGIIERYVSPPVQCRIGFYTRNGSEIRHPVISVPGNHRTPIWARAGGPDGQILQNDRVYVRRPGGSSETARTQDDWEKLIERLVRARQGEQLGAIREILNPSQEIVVEKPALEEWDEASLVQWREKVNILPDGDARRLAGGFWTFSFHIDPFNLPSLAELNESLSRDLPHMSGWPPFTYLHGNPQRPQPRGDVIEAWLAEHHGADVQLDDYDHYDYWRVSRDGFGFLLRPMDEDNPNYGTNLHPPPARPPFDWILPIYRTVELLKFVEALALKHATENSQYDVIIKYHNANGRILGYHSLDYALHRGAVCTEDQLTSRLSGTIADLGLGLEERVHALLQPIYEQFEFTNLAKVLVDNVTRDALGNRT